MTNNFDFGVIETCILSHQIHNIKFSYDNYKYIDLVCFEYAEAQLWSKLTNRNRLYVRFSKTHFRRRGNPHIYFFKWPKDERMFYSTINPFRVKSFSYLYYDVAINKLINVIIGNNKCFSDKYNLK